MYVSHQTIKPHHSLEPGCSSSTLGPSLYSLCSLLTLLVCLALLGVKHAAVTPFHFADWWEERRYASIYSEGRTEVRMTASWCRQNDQSQGHWHLWIASGPFHLAIPIYQPLIKGISLSLEARGAILYICGLGSDRKLVIYPRRLGRGREREQSPARICEHLLKCFWEHLYF